MYNEKDHTSDDNGSLEKGVAYDTGSGTGHGATHATVVKDERYHFDAVDLDRVQRRLKQRHVQMIAIAGTLGTGLFLGSGKALSTAGPLGALLAYALVGSVAYSSLCSVGEMTAHAPISGTFPHYAARWVDPAFGFAMGWVCVYFFVSRETGSHRENDILELFLRECVTLRRRQARFSRLIKCRRTLSLFPSKLQPPKS